MKPHLVPEVDGSMVLVTQAEIERLTPGSLAHLKTARRSGFMSSRKYAAAQARERGFKTLGEYRKSRGLAGGAYQDAKAQKRGFKNHAAYNEAQAQKRGFKNYSAYMKARGQTSGAYRNTLAQKKGFETSARQYSAVHSKNSRARLVLTQQMTLSFAGDVRSVYREAQLLTEWEGTTYEVDHLVPLMSPYVSGLHVEANLEAVPTELNAVKSNKVWEHMADVDALDERTVMLLEQAYEAKRQCIEAGKSLKAEAAYLRRLGEIFGAPSGKKIRRNV